MGREKNKISTKKFNWYNCANVMWITFMFEHRFNIKMWKELFFRKTIYYKQF